VKFLFCVEDDSDAAIFEALLTNLFGTQVQAQPGEFRLRRGGWNSVLALAPAVARKAHGAGMDGALFAIDNDGAEPLHSSAHETTPADECRVCALRIAARIEEPLSWPRPELPSLKYLFAVPVQALETWLLHAKDHRFKGPADELGKDASGRRELKRLLYGSDQPT